MVHQKALDLLILIKLKMPNLQYKLYMDHNLVQLGLVKSYQFFTYVTDLCWIWHIIYIFFSTGSKILYVARAQKKSERDEMLRRQFEEKRKERILKYQVLQESLWSDFCNIYFICSTLPLICLLQASNVYVKNIDDDISDDELRLHFSQCGEITSAKIMRDDKGVSKGFGFVCFSSPDEANKAVYAFHGDLPTINIYYQHSVFIIFWFWFMWYKQTCTCYLLFSA